MKLSNKILLGFFGFIFLYLTAVFAELRVKGVPNIINDGNSIAEKVDITGVAYIVLNDVDLNVSIIGSDRSELEVRSFSGGVLKDFKYERVGDTLTLSGFSSEETKSLQVSVFVSKNLEGITVKGSSASVRGLHQQLITISEDEGEIHLSDCEISSIKVEMENRSHLTISETTLDTLSAEIDHSQAYISSSAWLVQGSMENNSTLHLGEIREIQLKKDAGSMLYVFH